MVQVFVGRVVSVRMQKTVSVLVNRFRMHPRFNTIVRKTKKFLAHDPEEKANLHDIVRIRQCRPHSKRKAFELTEIVSRHKP